MGLPPLFLDHRLSATGACDAIVATPAPLARPPQAACCATLLVTASGLRPLIDALALFRSSRHRRGHYQGGASTYEFSQGSLSRSSYLAGHSGAISNLCCGLRRDGPAASPSVICRALYAIGFSSGGRVMRNSGSAAKGAGLSAAGLISSLAATVYVPSVRRAPMPGWIRSSPYVRGAWRDVRLRWTGTLVGTLLGLFSLSVLQNGLRLAACRCSLLRAHRRVLVATTATDEASRRRFCTSARRPSN